MDLERIAAFKLCSKPAMEFRARCDSQIRVSVKMDKEDHGWGIIPVIPTLGKQRQDGHNVRPPLSMKWVPSQSS